MKQKQKITFNREDALFILKILEKHEEECLSAFPNASDQQQIPYFYHLWAIISDIRHMG